MQLKVARIFLSPKLRATLEKEWAPALIRAGVASMKVRVDQKGVPQIYFTAARELCTKDMHVILQFRKLMEDHPIPGIRKVSPANSALISIKTPSRDSVLKIGSKLKDWKNKKRLRKLPKRMHHNAGDPLGFVTLNH
jgi:hypothetical protein